MSIRPRWALAGAGACLALLALVWVAAFHVGAFRSADQSTYAGFVDLHQHTLVESVSGFFVSLSNPNPYVYLAPMVALIALLRGRPRLALAALTILLGANVTTQLLKDLLAQSRPGYLLGGSSPLPPTSWPSGHSTAAMSLALCCVLVAPSRLRPAIAALGATFAIAVGYSVLAAGMHYPSDILGGFLVAATWTLLTVAALRAAERRRPTSARSRGRVSLRAALGPPGVVLLAAIVLVAIVIVFQPRGVVAYARAHEALVAVAAGIAALSLGLSTGVMLSVRR
jgi:membrane-associated phospholipid phosphatase